MLGINYQPWGAEYLYSNISQSYSQCGPDWLSQPSYQNMNLTSQGFTPFTSELSLVENISLFCKGRVQYIFIGKSMDLREGVLK